MGSVPASCISVEKVASPIPGAQIEEIAMSDNIDPQMQMKLSDLDGAICSLHDRLDDTGLLNGRDKVLLYQMLRVRRALGKVWGQAASADHWQQKIDELMGSGGQQTPKGDWKEYYVVAEAETLEENLHRDDGAISGVYSVLVDPVCISPATAALDAFHLNVGVKLLEDFSFSVIDPDAGEYVEEVEGVDTYSMDGKADFNGHIMDELPDDLQADLARGTWKEYLLVIQEDAPHEELHEKDRAEAGTYRVKVNPQCTCPADAAVQLWDIHIGAERPSDFTFTLVDPLTGDIVPHKPGMQNTDVDHGIGFGELDMCRIEWPMSQDAWNRLFGPDGLANQQ